MSENEPSSPKDVAPGSLRRLPVATVKLISSCQVITSVSTLVKELLENSFDAGATNVEVKLENYGFDRIEVRDNGRGIKGEDVPFVCQKSYTSKISSFADLGKLYTYGFRGEALNSICSLGQVTFTTKTEKDIVAHCYAVNHDGEITTSTLCPAGTGTTIVVEHIFKNLPVRKQFLTSGKRKMDELKKVEDIVKKLALINYKTRVVLQHNKFLIWQKSAVSNLIQSSVQVLPSFLVKQWHQIDYNEDDIEITLLIPSKDANLVNACYSGFDDGFYLFINSRPVKNKDIFKVLESEVVLYFASRIPSGRFPASLVSVVLPPNIVDVNLEPNKTKVIIKDMDRVAQIIQKQLQMYYFQADELELMEIPKNCRNKRKPDEENDEECCDKKKILKTIDEAVKVELKKIREEDVRNAHIAQFVDGIEERKMPDVSVTESRESSILTKTTDSSSPVRSDHELEDSSSLQLDSPLDPNSSYVNPLSDDVEKTEGDEITMSGWSRGEVTINGKILPSTVAIVGSNSLDSSKKDLSCSNEESSPHNRSVSSQMGRKDMSAFTKFAREIRSQIVRNTPTISFASMAREISKKWKNLQEEEKNMYKELVEEEKAQKKRRSETSALKPLTPSQSSVKRFIAPNRVYPCVVDVKITVDEIKSSIRNRRSLACTESGDLVTVGFLKEDLLLVKEDSTITAISCRRLNEAIRLNNYQIHSPVPSKNLENPLILSEENLPTQLLETLNSLETSPDLNLDSMQLTNATIVSDVRICKNGFRVEVHEGQFRLMCVPESDRSGLNDLKVILQMINDCPMMRLKECRTSHTYDYLRKIALETLNEQSSSMNLNYILDLYKYWKDKVKCVSDICPHGQPVAQQLLPL